MLLLYYVFFLFAELLCEKCKWQKKYIVKKKNQKAYEEYE